MRTPCPARLSGSPTCVRSGVSTAYEYGSADSDDEPQPASATATSALHQNRDRIALGLEQRLRDVAEILAVGLQRQRVIAAHLDPVEVVAREHDRVLVQ